MQPPAGALSREGQPLCGEAALHLVASTRPGDVVLDPFARSGTTGVTAQKLGRKGILADLPYHQLALRHLATIEE